MFYYTEKVLLFLKWNEEFKPPIGLLQKYTITELIIELLAALNSWKVDIFQIHGIHETVTVLLTYLLIKTQAETAWGSSFQSDLS